MYPDRIRSAWGRPTTISVERFDAAGKPMTGVLDMELIIETPGRPAAKAGFTEYTETPGKYDSMIPADALGIGRTDYLLVASQSGRPEAPIAMAGAAVTVEVVGGVRFAGPMTSRWQDDRLLVDIPISTRTAAHVTVRGELHAGRDVLAELTGEADVGDGEATITLDAGALIAADDPRLAALSLIDGIAVTTTAVDERWTDFWRGPRPITAAGVTR
jgi:hypothetical protein